MFRVFPCLRRRWKRCRQRFLIARVHGGSDPNFSSVHKNPPDGEIQLLRFIPSCCNSSPAARARVDIAQHLKA